ncbi:hypothetical protein CSC88_29585, partial [Klebsiella pneumoniae]
MCATLKCGGRAGAGVPACAKCSAPWPCSWSSALAYCWKRWGCRWRWGRFSPGCCWPVPNIVMRWRVI